MRYLTLSLTALVIFSGCSPKTVTRHNNTILGSWYTKEVKNLDNNKVVEITKKEQFFKNGNLLSSKWFHFKQKDGSDLGEYYITKLFTWRANKNIIEVKFKRCNTAVTSKLKANNLGYQALSQKCNAQKVTNKITKKRYRLLGDTLLLNSKKYLRER